VASRGKANALLKNSGSDLEWLISSKTKATIAAERGAPCCKLFAGRAHDSVCR
jgi:hypothetical protein